MAFLPVRVKPLAVEPKARVHVPVQVVIFTARVVTCLFTAVYRSSVVKVLPHPTQVEYNEVNLDQLDRFQAGSVVSTETLAEAKLLHKPRNPVAILGRGEVKVALTIQVQRIRSQPSEKIEAAGGKSNWLPKAAIRSNSNEAISLALFVDIARHS